MKILLVNRWGYPAYGGETYFLNLCRLLKERGHKVIVFTTRDKRNIDKEYADYCVNQINVGNLNSIPLLNRVLFAPKTIYSWEARRKIERLIRDTRPDIIHIHSIKRLISPSILHSAKKFNIPVVYTANDYHLICPNYRLFSKGKICEACKGNRYYKVILKRCVRNSFFLSLLVCIEQYVHSMLRIFENNVDMFIAPSNFLRKKMIENGIPPRRIVHIPYFVPPDDYQPIREFSNYIVYIGRLVEEKGLVTLIRAMKKIPNIKLVIIGEGEYRRESELLINREGINNVEVKGYLDQAGIRLIIGKSIFVVVPSEWYEIFGIVIIESFARGKPVVGADIGGIPELIDNGVNGLLFKPGDVNDLVEKIKYLLDNKDKIQELGRNARKKAVENYSPDVHYEKMIEVYKRLVMKR